jgi:hypothetical protein
LRLAIELDCDARVLHRGVQPRPYGSLLIDIAGQSAGHRIGALALADRTSHLERRLLAMKHSRTRFAVPRTGALCAIAFLSVAVACEARLPTSAEVDAMSAEGAERAAISAKLLAEIGTSKRLYFVDGQLVSQAEAYAVSPIKIANIEILKRKLSSDTDQVRIYTLNQKSRTTKELAKSETPIYSHLPTDSATAVHLAERQSRLKKDFEGVILIDGVESTSAALAQLPRDQIASIDVFKGAAAAKMSSDPAAANGIISIKMKAAQQ